MTKKMGSRSQILGRLTAALDRRGDGGEAHRAAAVDRRLAAHPVNLVPARGQLPPVERLALFVQMAEQADATVTRVETPAAVPAAVADYLRRANKPLAVRRAPDPALDAYPWQAEPLLHLAPGAADSTDETGLTAAHCGVAETGTLMLTSGAARPTTLNFLPETHIVVLRADQIVASYEDGWARLREDQAGADGWAMPRTVNFITGPSRSADIEQTLQLGAHGPKRLHIVIVGGEPPAPSAPESPAA